MLTLDPSPSFTVTMTRVRRLMVFQRGGGVIGVVLHSEGQLLLIRRDLHDLVGGNVRAGGSATSASLLTHSRENASASAVEGQVLPGAAVTKTWKVSPTV